MAAPGTQFRALYHDLRRIRRAASRWPVRALREVADNN